MATKGLQRREPAKLWAVLLLLCPLPAISACAANSYAGIPLAAGAADPELQGLAARARVGDEQAQLELGIRYEEGRDVPVDLARASALYFDAATRRRRGAAIYVPTPGGVSASFVRTLPGELEYSGLEEALTRWHRLLPRMTRTQRSAAALPPDQPVVTIEPDDETLELRRDRAALRYGLAPVFSSLRGAAPGWHARLTGQPGFQLLDARAINDSFLLLIEGPGAARPGASADPGAVRRFCADGLAAESWAVSEVRLFALCLAALRSATPDQQSRLEAGLTRYSEGPAHLSPDRASDLILLYRVGRLCGCAPWTEPLLARAAAEILAAERNRPRCGSTCDPELRFTLDRFEHAEANLLFARAESSGSPVWRHPQVAAALAASSRRLAVALGSFAGLREDQAMVETCARLDLDYPHCRRVYVDAPLLAPKTASIIAEFEADATEGSTRCARLQRRTAEVAAELSYRPAVAGLLSEYISRSCGT